ncbi:MAG: FHA domain-containing protein [Akkermansia sp.]|nr:FHA domain-containing protein [Akkermansia sp.]
MASLIITINERKQGFDLPAILGKVTVIGCDDACDITLNGVDGLSHRQCSITCTKEGFLLEDLESTNGTYANEQEVEEPQLMKEGVIYAIGDASMIIAELANFAPIEPKEAPVPAASAVVSEAKTAPISEAVTTPIPDASGAITAPLAEDSKTAPLADTAEPPTEHTAKPPAHTRPLPGRKPARKAKINAGQPKKRALTDEELKQKAKMLANAMGGSGVSTLYIVVILIAALYAGMALYSWQSEGNPVPAFFR